MTKVVQLFLLIFILSACGGSPKQEKELVEPTVQEQPDSLDQQNKSGGGVMVYVTSEGNKYHTADCRYSEHAIQVKLTQAKAEGKTACNICKPNSITGEKQIRCSAQTEEGKQCQRMTSDASGKCFQHQKK